MGEFDTLLKAIKKQRWYFFENNGQIIFDSQTGLIWANLNSFTYYGYNTSNNFEEVKNVLKLLNQQKFGSYNEWEIPTVKDFWNLIEDKTFPFQEGSNWRIRDDSYWCVVDEDDNLKCKDLNREGAVTKTSAVYSISILPCCRAVQFDSSTPIEILNLFKRHNLIPKFNKLESKHLYYEFLESKTEKPANIEKPAKIDLPEKITLDFSKYDAAAIDKSPIKYHKALVSVADELLEVLQKYEISQSEIISEASKITLKLNERYIDSPHLTPEENAFFKTRQQKLARLLAFNTDDAQKQILSIKAQAKKLAAHIDNINHSEISLINLAEIENTPRPSFEFLTENLTEIINLAQDKINFFVENKNFVTEIVKSLTAWNDDYIFFKTNLKSQFENLCRKNNMVAVCYDGWQKCRLAIEEKFLPLIEFSLKENCTDIATEILKLLQQYKSEVDNFYLNEKNIKANFNVAESPYQFAQKFQNAVQKIISKREKAAERLFLKKYAETLTN